MSYDLVVWVGERPAGAAAADELYEQIAEQLEEDDDNPPNPRLVAYAEALLERWPQDSAETDPWVVQPLHADAVGDVLPLGIKSEYADVVASYAAGLALKHGLVCYDPQEGLLRP